MRSGATPIFFSNFRVERSADAIYVFSEWLGQPLEVTKMNLLGELVWRKELPELMVQWGNNTPASCGFAVTVLANGAVNATGVHQTELNTLAMLAGANEHDVAVLT